MAIRKIISRSIGVDVIAAEDLAAGSVETAEIQNGAVTGPKLADNLNYDSGTLYLDSTNNRVGIGTTSPSRKLELNGGGVGSLVTFTDGVATNFTFKTDGSSVGTFGTEAGSTQLAFMVAGSEKIRVANDGDVGIGTSSPNANLHVSGSSTNVISAQVQNNEGTGSRIDLYSFGSSPAIQSAHRSAMYQWTGAGIDLWTRTGDLHFGTSNSEAMRIDSSGRVSIGGVQTDAGAKLSVISDSTITSGSSTTNEGILMIPSASLSSNQYAPWISWTGYPSSSAVQRGRAGIGAISTNNASGLELIFATRNAADGSVLSPADEKMRLTTGGHLCLNKTSDSFNDSVGISVNGAAGLIRIERNNDPSLQLNRMNANGEIVQFYRGAGNKVGNITGNTSSVSYNTSSDYRLKENVEYDFDASTRLKQLKPARFNFIADADTTVDGFLAHEVQDIVPEAITGEKDAVDDDGNPDYQAIDQAKLVPLLVKSLQEALTEIDSLKARLDDAGL